MNIWHLIWRYLLKPVLGGHPVLSGHYSIPRGCPLNTGFTVIGNSRMCHHCFSTHSFKECDAKRTRVTRSPSQHCVKARVYARSGVKHTSYDKGYANTCSPSAIDVCRDPSYKCEVSQLLLISLLQWSLRSCGEWDSSNCHRNCQLHVLDMFWIQLANIG